MLQAILCGSYVHTNNVSLFMYKHSKILENLINICYVCLENNTQQSSAENETQ